MDEKSYFPVHFEGRMADTHLTVWICTNKLDEWNCGKIVKRRYSVRPSGGDADRVWKGSSNCIKFIFIPLKGSDIPQSDMAQIEAKLEELNTSADIVIENERWQELGEQLDRIHKMLEGYHMDFSKRS